jgi:hypothetical protein
MGGRLGAAPSGVSQRGASSAVYGAGRPELAEVAERGGVAGGGGSSGAEAAAIQRVVAAWRTVAARRAAVACFKFFAK